VQQPGHGLSIVELMVGITIGLFILAGTTMMLTTQLGDNRKLLLEAQMQQDMRAAADMISRDIRRAGYWARAFTQVWPEPPPAVQPINNPYRVMTPRLAPQGTISVIYDRSTDEEGDLIGTDDDGVDQVGGRTREQVGFRLNQAQRTIEYLVGANNWQALTDSAVLQVTQFNMVLNARDLPVPCGVQCPVLGPGGCPLVQSAREVTLTIVAQAVHDATVQRSLQNNIRLRNDVSREVCPGP
jgi:type IV pilus assembly protein PilW